MQQVFIGIGPGCFSCVMFSKSLAICSLLRELYGIIMYLVRHGSKLLLFHASERCALLLARGAKSNVSHIFL
jgi:hypothetical protein